MTRVRKRGEEIRRSIIDRVPRHTADIAKVAAQEFGISRQAANKHLQKLVEEKSLLREGNTRNRTYSLRPAEISRRTYSLDGSLKEDVVWRNDIAPSLSHLPSNVLLIWQYGLTEMLNNAIDHSDGENVHVVLEKSTSHIEMLLMDDGIGIFKKIQAELGLLDERHSVLELAKGKLTTDPDNHSGEGIFFSSRMFDELEILSGGVYFSHEFGSPTDWIIERRRPGSGTTIGMRLGNHTSRTSKSVFDQFTSKDDFGFTRTIVPVRLAQYGDDRLVSRSQAKRLLVRVDRFKTVLFDFEGVDEIGQAVLRPQLRAEDEHAL